MLADLERARHPASSPSRRRRPASSCRWGSRSRRGLRPARWHLRRGSECRKSLLTPGSDRVRGRGRGGPLFDAQYTSVDTGLIYLRNRTYDPSTAQFLTIDPLDEGSSTLAHATGEQYVAAALRSAGGSGPYVYANDNPLKNYDPTGLFTVGICVHGEVNFILHIGASGCVQGSSSGEVGGTVAGSVGLAAGAGVGATVGPQVSNAEHISELSGPFANTGGQLGVGPDVSLEAFGAPGQCGPIVGGGVSAGAGLGVSRWIGGSYTGAWSVSF